MATATQTPGFAFARLVQALMGSSSISRSGPNMFETFGPAARNAKRRSAPKSPHYSVLGFSVSSAKNRLRGMLDTLTSVTSLESLQGLLSGNDVTIEARAQGKQQAVTYLRDNVTQRSVRAAEIDRRLSFRSLQQKLGFGREEKKVLTREERIGLSYRQVLLNVNRTQPGEELFESWDDMYFSLPNMVRGVSYIERNGVGIIGKVACLCPGTKEELDAIVSEAKLVGKRLLVPTAAVKGAPILDAAYSARAELVHKSLNAKRLGEKYGILNTSFFVDRDKKRMRYNDRVIDGKAVKTMSVAELRHRFARDPATAKAPEKPVNAFGFGFNDDKGRIIVRQDINDHGAEEFKMLSGSSREDIPGVIQKLPAGTYDREDAYGLRSGSVVVDEDGTVRLLNLKGDLHNESGPAVIAPPHVIRPKIYSIDGVKMSRQEFAQSVARMRENGLDTYGLEDQRAVTDRETTADADENRRTDPSSQDSGLRFHQAPALKPALSL